MQDPDKIFRSNEKSHNALLAAVQERVEDPVMRAAVFQPNSKIFFFDPGGLFTWISKRRALDRGALANTTVWALTDEFLHVFKAHDQMRKPHVYIRDLLGTWRRSQLIATRIPQREGQKDDPSFAISVETPTGQRIEVAATSHDHETFEFIQALVDPTDAAAAEALARSVPPEVRARRMKWVWVKIAVPFLIWLGLVLAQAFGLFD